MADTVEIPTKCIVTVPNSDDIHLSTKTNGDRIMIENIQLTAEQAASLSYLINNQQPLVVEIEEA